ncbi:MAG: response regulator transcription factor [Burkholderiales bacterium]|jgi:RNA polymerase sigma factor (sigma-70 family)|nr:MAG: response regulator transcription factor [Burkholderiales bacterium]
MSLAPTAYLVDDDSAIRDSLSLWLGMRGIRCVAYESAEAFLAAVQPESRGCVLIDLQLEGIDGLQLQARLAQRKVTMPIIFVTGHGDVAAARDALKAGALDFIEKPVDNERLVELVETALTKDTAAAQRQEQAALVSGRLQRLTQREREVMEQVVAGRHNREIAVDLGISPRTVEVYKSRLMDKLDVRRVADLVKLALEAQADSRS